MRKIAGPQQLLVRHDIDRMKRRRIVLERHPDVTFEYSLGSCGQAVHDAALGVDPGGVIHAVHIVRHPAGVALGTHEFQLRMTLEDPTQDQEPDHILDRPDDAEKIVHLMASMRHVQAAVSRVRI